MDRFIKSKLSWILAAIFAVVFWAALYLINLNYVSQIEILFIPKSEKLGQNFDQIADNAVQITQTQNYLPSLENAQVKARRIENTSIIQLSASAKNKNSAKTSVQTASQNLVTLLSHYYNIKDDLDMRIIDGPVSQRSSSINFFSAAIISIIFGFVVSFLTFFLADYFNQKNISSRALFPDIFSKENLTKKVPQYLTQFDHLIPKSKTPETKEASDTSDTPASFQNEIPKFSAPTETIVTPPAKPAKTFEKKSSAPDNLPVSDVPNIFGGKPEKIQPKEQIKNSDNNKEKKSRLNRLISGVHSL